MLKPSEGMAAALAVSPLTVLVQGVRQVREPPTQQPELEALWAEWGR